MCPYPDSYGREQIATATGIDVAKIQVRTILHIICSFARRET